MKSTLNLSLIIAFIAILAACDSSHKIEKATEDAQRTTQDALMSPVNAKTDAINNLQKAQDIDQQSHQKADEAIISNGDEKIKNDNSSTH